MARDRLDLQEMRQLVQDAGFRPTMEVESVEEAIRVFTAGAEVDLVIVNCLYGRPCGCPGVRALRQMPMPKRIVVLTRDLSGPWLARLLDDGADSVLKRDIASAALRRCLTWTLMGAKVLPAEAATALGGPQP